MVASVIILSVWRPGPLDLADLLSLVGLSCDFPIGSSTLALPHLELDELLASLGGAALLVHDESRYEGTHHKEAHDDRDDVTSGETT